MQLKQWLKLKKIKQYEIAKHLGMSAPSMSRIINTCELTLREVIEISVYTGGSVQAEDWIKAIKKMR